jgi:putative ABC transport system permease protein
VTGLIPALAALRRRPGRTFLTSLGTALGIATIVALLAVAQGAQRAAGQFLHLGQSDLGLFQRDAADPTTSVLPLSLIQTLRKEPGIVAATPLLLLVGDVKPQPGAIVFGADPHGFLLQRLVFTAGHVFGPGRQAIVGDQLAAQMHLHVGDTLTLAHRPLLVTGIYHIGVAFQDEGAFVPLALSEAIAGRPDEATTIAVKLGVGTNSAAATRMVRRRFPGITVIGSGQEAPRAGANATLLSKASLVIAVLALVIGGIGVMNTMLMSVVERRSEFALLSAVGWSAGQIVERVVVEAVLTTLIGAIIGLLVGVIGAHLLVGVLGARQFVAPQFTAWAFGRALLVGVLIGALGSLYPAWRAARLSPARVLAQR